jgi:cell division protein FtsZ
MLKQPWLEIAEYASLAGSVLGIIAAATSSQVIYAAAPLTLALSLNLVNRKQSHQQTRQHIISAIADVHQVIQSLHQQVQTLPTQAINLTEIEADIAALKAQLQALECADTVQPSHNNESQLASINDSKEIPQQEITSDNIALGSLAKILVIGVGGGGCKAINRMIEAEVTGVEFLQVDTNANALAQSSFVAKQLQIGQKLTRGLGGGEEPVVGQKAAEISRDEIANAIGYTDVVFIVAGMGKGTGTGAAPIIAEVAKETGALTIGVVSRPFSAQRRKLHSQAKEGIAALESRVDTLVVVPLNKLLSVLSEQTAIQEAFRVADDILRQAVQGISDVITNPGLFSLDFSHVRGVMADAGSVMMAMGVGSGKSRAREAAMAAISSPLLEYSIEGAKGVIIKITCGSDFTYSEFNAAVETISEVVDPSANIIFDIVVDDKMQGEVTITVIATGYSRDVPDTRSVPYQQRRVPDTRSDESSP